MGWFWVALDSLAPTTLVSQITSCIKLESLPHLACSRKGRGLKKRKKGEIEYFICI